MGGFDKGAVGVVAALGLLTGLAGCGGGAGAVPSNDQVYESTQDSFLSMYRSVMGDAATGQAGLTHTSPSNMPTSGAVKFTGYAKVIIGNQALSHPEYVAYGTATMQADFTAGTVTGSAKDFYGGPVSQSTGNLSEKAAQLSGTMTLSQGCIGATACGGAVSTSYQTHAVASGTLSGGGHTVSATVPETGTFYGNPNVKALEMSTSASDQIGRGTLDGTTTDADVVFVGKP